METEKVMNTLASQIENVITTEVETTTTTTNPSAASISIKNFKEFVNTVAVEGHVLTQPDVVLLQEVTPFLKEPSSRGGRSRTSKGVNDATDDGTAPHVSSTAVPKSRPGRPLADDETVVDAAVFVMTLLNSYGNLFTPDCADILAFVSGKYLVVDISILRVLYVSFCGADSATTGSLATMKLALAKLGALPLSYDDTTDASVRGDLEEACNLFKAIYGFTSFNSKGSNAYYVELETYKKAVETLTNQNASPAMQEMSLKISEMFRNNGGILATVHMRLKDTVGTNEFANYNTLYDRIMEPLISSTGKMNTIPAKFSLDPRKVGCQLPVFPYCGITAEAVFDETFYNNHFGKNVKQFGVKVTNLIKSQHATIPYTANVSDIQSRYADEVEVVSERKKKERAAVADARKLKKQAADAATAAQPNDGDDDGTTTTTNVEVKKRGGKKRVAESVETNETQGVTKKRKTVSKKIKPALPQGEETILQDEE